MSRETENPFAFPLTDGKSFATDGMRLRDYFAAKAVQGIISHSNGPAPNWDKVASDSYAAADAMLKERNKTK